MYKKNRLGKGKSRSPAISGFYGGAHLTPTDLNIYQNNIRLRKRTLQFDHKTEPAAIVHTIAVGRILFERYIKQFVWMSCIMALLAA